MEDRTRLEQLGWDGRWQAAAAAAGAEGTDPARVIRVDRGAVMVSGSATEPIRIPSARIRADEPAVVGDWLLTDGEYGHLLPARTSLARQRVDGTSHTQPLAANVDVVFVVEPAMPAPNRRRIDRFLVLAEASGALPVVLITKADLITDQSAVDELLAQIQRHGVDALLLQALSGEGLAEVRARIRPGQTAVFVGPSGAGKSTLINALTGTSLSTAGVRNDGRGRHTTSHRELVLVEGGGCVIDTPGIRSVGLVGDAEAVDRVFADVLEFASGCRYRDCRHADEPGCGVTAAVEAGMLERSRYEQYLDYAHELEQAAARAAQRSHREARNDTAGRQHAKRVASAAKGRERGQ